MLKAIFKWSDFGGFTVEFKDGSWASRMTDGRYRFHCTDREGAEQDITYDNLEQIVQMKINSGN